MRYAPIIGLEVHVRLKTATKMFCRCPNVPETTPPNTAICPICTGQPGALPVVNEQAIRLGVRLGLALGATIPAQADFDRKHYFYPDLPKGYQITQYQHPIVEGGSLSIPSAIAHQGERVVGITRAHLEEDAAKNIHDTSGNTFIDYNRAGAPLIEIVTEPDLRSPQEAKSFLQELQAILRVLGVSDADMEKGYMRCDANISLLPIGDEGQALQQEFNPKVEVKNMNSFKSVERAITFEIERQTALYAQGASVPSETRGWDDVQEQTLSQRTKEGGADYRFMPEPDLPTISLTRYREEERSRLPELPAATRARLQHEYAFEAEDARLLVERGWASFAEYTISELGAWMEAHDTGPRSGGQLLEDHRHDIAKLLSNWLLHKLAAILNERHLELKQTRLTAENFAEFLQMLDSEQVKGVNAQKLLALMVDTGGDPSNLTEEHGLAPSNDQGALLTSIRTVIDANPAQAEQVRGGKEAVLKWFVGQVMRATGGKMDAKDVEDLLRKELLR